MYDLQKYCGNDDYRITTALVDAALAMGCKLSVNDGEEWTVKSSTDREEIISALGSTGADTLRVRSPISSENPANFYLVYGNGDATTICDYTDNGLGRDLYAKVEPLIDELTD